MQNLPRYSARQARRHEVKPGFTGRAQVQGRNTLTWDGEFELDVWYLDDWSLWLDVCILVPTVGQVRLKSGISRAGAATMQESMGPQTAVGATRRAEQEGAE